MHVAQLKKINKRQNQLIILAPGKPQQSVCQKLKYLQTANKTLISFGSPKHITSLIKVQELTKRQLS